MIELLERLSPPSYACSWDNVGLLVGRREQQVHKIVVGLDATEELIAYAIEQEADMIITHHPMIFSSMKQINGDDFIGRKILSLAEHGIAYYAMHTNFDIKGSMADLAAERLELQQTKPLEVTVETETGAEGIGRVGFYREEVSLETLANKVKEAFDLEHVLVYGKKDISVHRLAVSPGSGKSVIGEAVKAGADVLITGDIGHHDGLDAMEQGLCIIDAGHYGLEHIFIDYIKEYLKGLLSSDVEVITWKGGVPYEVI
jgi:dinuclear metal center YbgI/SA1388 family protein